VKKIHLSQGSPEWLAHRARACNASELAVVMGLPGYITRSELIAQKATGIVPEPDEATQRRFDRGHEFEAIARPWAEDIIGEDLYASVFAAEVDGLLLSASLDGHTMLNDRTNEHKSGNVALLASLDAGVIPEQYHPQMEQGLMLTGASRCLFMASSGVREDMRHCWYESDPVLRAKIIPAWKQFQADVAAYVPSEAIEKPVAQAVEALPAVLVQVSGEISVRDNFPAFEVALRDFLDNRLIRKPATDQDFADLDLQIKALKNAEAALDAAESQWLSQVSSIDGMKRVKDMLHKLTRDNRLMAEKVLAARKEEIKAEIVAGGVAALREHIAGLTKRLGAGYGLAIPADFAGVIKGKRSIDSLNDAVGTELARAKIAANELADRIDANIKTLTATGADHLFGDRAALVLKQADDLVAIIAQRLAAETARQEQERERIRAEEAERVESEHAAKVDAARVEAQRIATEQAARGQAEAQKAVAPVIAPAFVIGQGLHGSVVEVWAAPKQPQPAADTGKRINLTEINARLSPVSITVAGLSELGFEPVEQVKASRLYRASDLPAICQAISAHVLAVAATRKAATA